MIPHSREFFIATADHEEWGHAHTGWGQVCVYGVACQQLGT